MIEAAAAGVLVGQGSSGAVISPDGGRPAALSKPCWPGAATWAGGWSRPYAAVASLPASPGPQRMAAASGDKLGSIQSSGWLPLPQQPACTGRSRVYLVGEGGQGSGSNAQDTCLANQWRVPRHTSTHDEVAWGGVRGSHMAPALTQLGQRWHGAEVRARFAVDRACIEPVSNLDPRPAASWHAQPPHGRAQPHQSPADGCATAEWPGRAFQGLPAGGRRLHCLLCQNPVRPWCYSKHEATRPPPSPARWQPPHGASLPAAGASAARRRGSTRAGSGQCSADARALLLSERKWTMLLAGLCRRCSVTGGRRCRDARRAALSCCARRWPKLRAGWRRDCVVLVALAGT